MENPSVKWGLIAGLGVMISSLLFYLVDVNLFFSVSSYLIWIVYIVCMVFAVRDQIKAQKGFISFKEAFSTAFVVFVLSSLMYYIFYYLMFNVIDPDLLDIQREMTVEAMEALSGFLSEEQMEEAIAKATSQDVGIGTVSMAYLISLIFPGAIIAAIIAAIMKKNNPNKGIV